MCRRGGWRQCVCFTVNHTWQSQLRSDCLAGPSPDDTGREGGGAGTEEWQHRCIIHLYIIPRFFLLSSFWAPQKKEEKKKGRAWPVFFCLCKWHVSERDWGCADGKGCIFSLNLDFIYSHWYWVMELSCKWRQHRWKWETSRWESHRGRHSGTENWRPH